MENTQQHEQQSHAVYLALLTVACILVVFTFATFAVLIGFVKTFIAYVVIACIAIGAWQYKRWEHHRHDIKDRLQLRDLARDALNNGHSVEFKPATRELRTISPWTIPSSPITIKDNTFGMPQLAGPVGLPDKLLAIDIMRKFHLSPEHIFLALGKGNREITCTLEGLMHVAHDAPTGQGKTAQWMAEIVQLLKIGVKIILCNPHFAPVSKKGDDWRPIGRAIEQQGLIELEPGLHVPGLIRLHENIANILKLLSHKELARRFTLQAQGDYSYEPLYIFIDEWPSIVTRHPEAGDYLVDVLQRGRAVDVCVDTNAQGFLSEDVSLKGSARENFSTAFHMGGSVFSGAKLLDMPVKEFNEVMRKAQVALGRGIAMLRNNEASPVAQLVRLPYAENEFVYYMLGRADTWMLPEFRNSRRNVPENGNISQDFRNGEEQPGESLYAAVPDVPENEASTLNTVDTEEREQIIRLAKVGVPRREMCLALGKGKYYYETVKQVLDSEGL